MTDGVMQLLKARQERIAELEAALHALVAKDPPTTHCWHCGAHGVMTANYDAAGVLVGEPSVHMAHKPDCPWLKARALLAEKGAGDNG